MTAYLLFFVFGAAIGVMGRHAWGDAMRLKVEDEAAKKWYEMNVEIRRLRTLVASIIGREDRLTATEVAKARSAAGPRPDPEIEFMLGL